MSYISVHACAATRSLNRPKIATMSTEIVPQFFVELRVQLVLAGKEGAVRVAQESEKSTVIEVVVIVQLLLLDLLHNLVVLVRK